MRKNGIEVLIKSASGESLLEIDSRSGSSRTRKCYLEVTPSEAFSIKITLLESFKWGRFKHAELGCSIDGEPVNSYRIKKIMKPNGFNYHYGKYLPHWEASNGEFDCGIDTGSNDFAFGRKMNEFHRFRKLPEEFAERGKIRVAVWCGRDPTHFEFIYATKDILEDEGIIATNAQAKGQPTTMFGIGRHTTVNAGSKVSRAPMTNQDAEIPKSRRAKAGLSSTAKPSGVTKRPPKEHEKAGYVAGLLALVSPAAGKPGVKKSQ